MKLVQTIDQPISQLAPAQVLKRFLYWKRVALFAKKPQLMDFMGQHILVDAALPATVEDYVLGLREFEAMSFMLHYLRKDSFLVDIGAETGSYSMLAAGIRNAFVLGFESDEDLRERYLKHIEINQLASYVVTDKRLVRFKEQALVKQGDEEDEIGSDMEGEHRLAVALDDLDLQQAPDMVRINAKGYNLEVIRGMGDMLQEPSLQAILLRLDRKAEVEVERLCHELLVANGFTLVTYNYSDRSLQPTDRFGEGNHLYVRDVAAVQMQLSLSPPIPYYGKEL